jgi:hypothetical protein
MTATAAPSLTARARAIGIVGDNWPYGANLGHNESSEADHGVRCAVVDWAEARKLRHSRAGRCLHWIATGRCAEDWCKANATKHRWMDHVSGWTRDGKPAVLVCQPYGVHDESLRDILRVADEYQLEAHIDGTGWYGHGTTFIALSPRETA